MHATPKQMEQAVITAYVALGVKNFTMINGVFQSGVQHSSSRAKSIMRYAAARLEREGLEHTLHLIHSNGGQAQHAIAY